MKREYHKWFSPRLERDMELLSFGDRGTNVLVFPTRVGKFSDYEDWGIVNALRDKIEGGYLRLVCLDSIDEESFYCDWNNPEDRIKRHQLYEEYILEEVFPYMQSSNNSSHTISHGCSLGAYHAMNIALRHPEKFDKIVSLSGRYDLTVDMGSHRNLFDGHYDEDIYYHMPLHYMAQLTEENILNSIRDMDIIFTIGEDDAFLSNNQAFSEVLTHKGIDHQFYIWAEEAHRARYWRQMVRFYL